MEAGFLGVGNMGLPMAGKLLDGGHRLTVYDLARSGDAAAGATEAKFPGSVLTRRFDYGFEPKQPSHLP